MCGFTMLLCMMNQAFCPIDQFEWCVYVLFISDNEYINKHCMLDSTLGHAVSLDGWMAVGCKVSSNREELVTT